MGAELAASLRHAEYAKPNPLRQRRAFLRLSSLSRKITSANTDILNYYNISIARGIQGACGYDMLRMNEPAAVMGEMSPDGVVLYDVFNAMDQGLRMSNVKYALIECPSQIFIKAENDIASEGVRFLRTIPEVEFRTRQPL